MAKTIHLRISELKVSNLMPAPKSNAKTLEERARLIAAAPDLLAEMKRYLPILDRVFDDRPEVLEGLGIATLNGYRAAIQKAEGGE